MERPVRSSPALMTLLSMAAIVVVVAGMRAAQSLVIPFLIAAFLAIICAPPLAWLRDKRVPTVVALIIVISVASLVFVMFVVFAGASINDFRNNFDEMYAPYLNERTEKVIAWFDTYNIDIPENVIEQNLDTQRFMQFVVTLLGSAGSAFSNIFLVLLTLIFLLLEVSGFPKKLIAVSGGSTDTLERFREVTTAVRNYISIKTWVSLATGAVIYVWLKYLEVDYALLWGLLAFFFNFVPNIGSFIAAIPAVALTYIKPGPTEALYAALGYVVVNVLVGNFIEPRLMGRGLGISTLVVFISLVFWGWVLGPVGMLLSVPLTIIFKIIMEGSDETRWLAVLLSADPEPDDLSAAAK